MLIRQNATLKIKSIEIFAIMSCVFVTGIVLRFLEVSQSLSIKNKIAAMIPIRHGCKVTPDEVYAKTLSRNFPAIRVLEKLAFIKSDESPATIMSEFVDFEDEESCLELISKYKLENKNCVTD